MLTLEGLVFDLVKMPPSSMTASSTMPRVLNVLCGSPSDTVYCAETLVDLASQPVSTYNTANNGDKIICKKIRFGL